MDYRACAELLLENNNYLIVTHRNPDGDTLGSAAALCSALKSLGKKAALYPNPGITQKYLQYVKKYLEKTSMRKPYVIAVDCATEQLLADGFEGKVQLEIDHHPTNTNYAEHCLVEPDKAACGEIILAIINELGAPLEKETAELLYIAISTDTGCFQYSNTNAATFRAAAELMDAGVDNNALNLRFFRKVSKARIMLEGYINSSISIHRDGKIAVATVTKDMIERSGAGPDDCDDLANLANRAEGCVLCVTIREQDGGNCRISMRSTPEINCSEICAVFGGGGHAAAAGCSIAASPEKAKELILAVIDEVWK